MNIKKLKVYLHIFLLILVFSVTGTAREIPQPKDVLGFTPGEDYKLANWAKIVEYFQKLDGSSDRVVFREIGKTTMGRPFVYAVISSPENLKKLDYYKEINDKLADPRKIKRSDETAEKLIREGKTFVLITHGIHSTEVGSTLSSTLTAHRLAASNDAEIRSILDKTIIVIVPSLNPDGVDIVKKWYDKTLGTPYEGTSPPELYHKFVGHDNNRDWYAFTQVETQYTVEKIHNVFHPQIVHDVHQQGRSGSRFFVPPFLDPVEPNVPDELIEGYTEIGNYIADQMRGAGFKGITTGSTYDAWTPARAYSHYHGGVRILSETASARLASPVEIDFKKMTSRRGFNVFKESANYSPLWKGGRWGIRDITSYMTTGAFYLMKHAAENRERWLKRFYKIGKDATRPRNNGELNGFIVEFGKNKNMNGHRVKKILEMAGVETEQVSMFRHSGKTYQGEYFIVKAAQPYFSFAKAMLERQTYPDLKDEKNNPIPPYDVTAHTLPLMSGVSAVAIMERFGRPIRAEFKPGAETGVSDCKEIRYQIFRSNIPSMDEGWTRWVFEEFSSMAPLARKCRSVYETINTRSILKRKLNRKKVVIFPDQSTGSILDGYKKGDMPKEYVGGLGKKGVKNLRKFVKNGGTLVFLNRSSNFAIEQLKLPVVNIAKNWERKDFFVPGSILRTELDTSHPISTGMDQYSVAWFERSPVFEIKTDPNAKAGVRAIAKYPANPKEILLSGWALGTEKIAGKAALVEVRLGKGRIILFGFRPQYRGQTTATFPLLFNTLAD